MSTSNISTSQLATALKISAGFFLASALFDVLSENINSVGLFYVWLVIKYLAYAIFVWVLYVGSKLSKEAEGNLQIAMGATIILIIIDIIFWVMLLNGSYFLWYGLGGIILYFAIDIVAAVAFLMAFTGMRKLDSSMNNPAYLIYGLAGIILEIIYWIMPYEVSIFILDVEFWVLLASLIFVAVMQFIKAGQVDKIVPHRPPAAGTIYTPYQPTQPSQPLQQSSYASYRQNTSGPTNYPQPTTVTQEDKFNPTFCTTCGAKLEKDAKFCTNCGSTV